MATAKKRRKRKTAASKKSGAKRRSATTTKPSKKKLTPKKTSKKPAPKKTPAKPTKRLTKAEREAIAKREAANARRRERRAEQKAAAEREARAEARKRAAVNKRRREQRAAKKAAEAAAQAAAEAKAAAKAKARKRTLVELPKPEEPGPRVKGSKGRPADSRGVFLVGAGDAGGYDEGEGYFAERAMISSAQNHVWKNNYAEVLGAWFYNYASKALVGDIDAIEIWRYGVLFSSDVEADPDVVNLYASKAQRLMANMLPASWAAHIVNEQTHLTVRIGLGDYEESSTFEEAVRELWKQEDTVTEIIEELAKITDGGYWFAFLDVPTDYATSEPPHGEKRKRRMVYESSRRGRGRGWNR